LYEAIIILQDLGVEPAAYFGLRVRRTPCLRNAFNLSLTQIFSYVPEPLMSASFYRFFFKGFSFQKLNRKVLRTTKTKGFVNRFLCAP